MQTNVYVIETLKTNLFFSVSHYDSCTYNCIFKIAISTYFELQISQFRCWKLVRCQFQFRLILKGQIFNLHTWKSSDYQNCGFKKNCLNFIHCTHLRSYTFYFLSGFDILVHEMFGQSENCGLLSANIPKRYIKLGSTGKAVPGVKTKIIVNKEEEVLKTPMLEGGFSPEIGEVWIVRAQFCAPF